MRSSEESLDAAVDTCKGNAADTRICRYGQDRRKQVMKDADCESDWHGSGNKKG